MDQQFEQYFRDESGLNRKNIQDNRVHCCLYFISPFGHGCVAVLVPGLGWMFLSLHHCPLPQQCPPYPLPRRLRPVDVGFMKALHEKVNIVPLIAKADCLVPSEIRKLKDRVSLLEPRGLGQKRQGSWPVPSQALTCCRYGRRSTSLGSMCTSSQNVTQMKMKTSSNRTGN